MPTTGQLAFYDDSAQGWERALYVFLGDKQPTVYLWRLERQEDRSWRAVAEAIGV